MQAVRLGPWRDEGFSYRRYRGKWFTLDSTADEQGTRRVIVRAEQIFAAFRQILPPRNAAAQPPRLVVLGSMDQYQTLLVKLGLTMSFQNPACFLEDRNVVAIGSDLAHLAAVTRTIAAENAQLRAISTTSSDDFPNISRRRGQPPPERRVQRRYRQGCQAGADAL